MMRIGELARATRESVKTLRYWSDQGLLESERTESGYRTFAVTMKDRAHFLRQAQALGFSLGEVREILRLRDDGSAPCADVRERLASHLATIRERITALRTLEDELERRVAWASAVPEPDCRDGCVYLAEGP